AGCARRCDPGAGGARSRVRASADRADGVRPGRLRSGGRPTLRLAYSRVMRSALLGLLTLSLACSPPAVKEPTPPVVRAPPEPMAYLRGTLVPWPKSDARGRISLTDPERKRVASYDSALVVLTLIRRGTREEAARVIEGLYAMQRPDGSLPFSFVLPEPEEIA